MSLRTFLPRIRRNNASSSSAHLVFPSSPAYKSSLRASYTSWHLECAPVLLHRGRWRWTSHLAPARAVDSNNTAVVSSVASFNNLMDQLTTAVKTRSIDLARSSFWDYLVAHPLTVVEFSSPNAQQQCKNTVTAALRLVSESGDSKDLELVERVLRSMSQSWGLAVDGFVHDQIVRGLCTLDELKSAVNWLASIQKKPGGGSASRELWHHFFKRCVELRIPNMILSGFDIMRHNGCPPNSTSYWILLDSLFQSSGSFPRYQEVRGIIQDMVRDGVPFTRAVLDLLIDAYEKVGSAAISAKVKRLYEEMNPSDEQTIAIDGSSGIDRNRMLAAASVEHKLQAVRLLEAYILSGFRPTRDTLAAVTETVKKVSDLVFWEKKLGIKADAAIWAIVIRNAAQNSADRYDALEAYRTVGRRGIRKTAAMFRPLIRAVCTSRTHAPADEVIDQALVLFEEYLNDSDESEHRRSLPIYNTLLRALTMSPNTRKYLPVAVSFVEEMQLRDIPVDEATMTSIIIMLMGSSRDPSEAFDVYRRFHKTKNGRYSLDPTGYGAVLNAFSKRTFFSAGPTGSLYYFDILKDMRDAGYPISVRIYTILLRRLAVVASKLAPIDGGTLKANDAPVDAAHEQVVAVIKRTHNIITLDGSLVPDIALWNQLMDTYQRAGCFREAYNIWQTMFLSDDFDNASISIIVDACAYAGADVQAVDIYTKLHERGHHFNLRNWNNWLECLCRLGKLDLAVKMMCLEMVHERNSQPNQESARIVLKFAMRTNQESEVRSRIKRYLPDLWNKLPNSIRQEPIYDL